MDGETYFQGGHKQMTVQHKTSFLQNHGEYRNYITESEVIA